MKQSSPWFAVALTLFASSAFGQQPKKAPPTLPQYAEEFAKFRKLDAKAKLTFIEDHPNGKDAFQPAKKGDLVTMIIERGSVEPVDPAEIICRVKAAKGETVSTSIKWVIDDGSMVKKGDKLLTLDDSALQDQKKKAQVHVKEKEGALAKAVESLSAAKEELSVNARLAEAELKLAEADLKNPPAGANKEVLQLRTEIRKLLVEKAKSGGEAKVKQAELEKIANSLTLKTANEELTVVEEQIAACTLTAPMDGIAVYFMPESSRFGSSIPLIEPGAGVREGQKLLRVIDLNKLAIGTRVHEAVVSKVRTGQESHIRIDAFPDKALRGKVKSVSAVASAPDFGARDVKVYPVTIAFDDVLVGVKPGMSGEIQIPTGEKKGVLAVPLSALWGLGGRDRVCYVKVGDEIVERRVTTGAASARAVEITSGLKEGEELLIDLRRCFAK